MCGGGEGGGGAKGSGGRVWASPGRGLSRSGAMIVSLGNPAPGGHQRKSCGIQRTTPSLRRPQKCHCSLLLRFGVQVTSRPPCRALGGPVNGAPTPFCWGGRGGGGFRPRVLQPHLRNRKCGGGGGGDGARGSRSLRTTGGGAGRAAPEDRGGGGWHEDMVLVCLPLAAPIGLSALHILTLCGPERVLVVSTDPLDELSCLTTPGSAVPVTGCCPCR